jgi:hypothetical protein
LQWVIASKQVCRKAVEQFQRNATWTFTDDAVYDWGVVGRWSNPASSRRATRLGIVLFVPKDSRNIVVQPPLLIRERCEIDDRGKPEGIIDVEGNSIIPYLSSHLTGLTNLQTLNLILYANDRMLQSPVNTPVKVTFGQLSRHIGPSLRQVKFAVEYDSYFLERRDYMCALMSGIIDTGGDVVGGNGVRDSRRVSNSPTTVVYMFTRKSS